MIALALSACKPKILLADEPTTALDATVQIQMLILLRELQRELGLSMIFVTHDIGAAVEVADRMAVMYAGRIVEEGPIARRCCASAAPPVHRSRCCKSRAARRMDRGQRLQAIGGAPPDLAALPPGCAFAPRCAHARPACLRRSAAQRSAGQRPPRQLRAGGRSAPNASNTAAASPAAA